QCDLVLCRIFGHLRDDLVTCDLCRIGGELGKPARSDDLLSADAKSHHYDLVQATITDAQCSTRPHVECRHVADLHVPRIGKADGCDFELGSCCVLGVYKGGKCENDETAAKR